mgnify:CR=1 FL=1
MLRTCGDPALFAQATQRKIDLAETTPTADHLDEVVDYDFIRSTIAERMARGHIHLQETLCDDVMTAMLAHPKVRAVRVSTEIPHPTPQ